MPNHMASNGDGQFSSSSSMSGTSSSIPTRNGTGSHGAKARNNNPSEKIKIFRSLLSDSSEEERRVLIEELLKQCELSSLEYIASLISELRVAQSSILFDRCGDPFAVLPHPIVLKILRFLDPISLCKSMRVSRVWRRHCGEPCIWKSLCHLSRDYRMCNREAERLQLAKFTSGGSVRWKEAFAERYRLWSNWHSGRCSVRTLYGHTQGVVCVQFDGDRVVSGSTDTTIRFWDLRESDGAGLGGHTLLGHSSTVRCLHLQGNRLASGGNDFNIKVWDMEMNKQWSSIACRRTLSGHTNYVRCLEMAKEYLISGSYDSTLKLWSMETGDCASTLVGHSDSVLCEQYNEEEHRIVSGSSDKCIKLWDTRARNSGMSIHCAHDSAVTCVRMDIHRIVSGSLDRMIKMWDLRAGRLLRTIDWRMAEGHTGVVRCLQADSWRIVSSADDRTIKVWNLETGERLCTLRDHNDGVTCVQFSDLRIVSGSFDKTVKVWDFTAN